MDYTLDLTKILLIFIILSILGLNIFYYLTKTADKTGEIARDTIQTGIETSKQGVEYGLSAVNKGLTGGIQQLQNDINKPSPPPPQQINYETRDSERKELAPQDYEANGMVSYPQKRGYCYIGEEERNRSCIYVGPNDLCMSQEIYPTMDVCINPSLRV